MKILARKILFWLFSLVLLVKSSITLRLRSREKVDLVTREKREFGEF